VQKGGAGGGFGGHGHPGRRRTNSRTSMAQRDEVIRRTVYVSSNDHQVQIHFLPHVGVYSSIGEFFPVNFLKALVQT